MAWSCASQARGQTTNKSRMSPPRLRPECEPESRKRKLRLSPFQQGETDSDMQISWGRVRNGAGGGEQVRGSRRRGSFRGDGRLMVRLDGSELVFLPKRPRALRRRHSPSSPPTVGLSALRFLRFARPSWIRLPLTSVPPPSRVAPFLLPRPIYWQNRAPIHNTMNYRKGDK